MSTACAQTSLVLRAAVNIRSVLADGRIELVHVNEAHALTAAWLAGAHHRVPLVSSRRIGFPLQKNWVSQSRYAALERFIANSKDVAQSLIDSGFPSDRISIVNEGVEIPDAVSLGERQLARKKWGVADDEFLFGCASAFVPEKGQRHLVEALPAVRKQFPKVRLLLVGEGRSRSQDSGTGDELWAGRGRDFSQDLSRTCGNFMPRSMPLHSPLNSKGWAQLCRRPCPTDFRLSPPRVAH